jgi:hypothetical protein
MGLLLVRVFRGLAQSQIVIYVVCLCCQSVDRDNGR